MSAPIQVSPGVEKTVITKGTGAAVTRGATVTVHCTGMLTAGLKKFWSTHDPGQSAFTFKAGVGQVSPFLVRVICCCVLSRTIRDERKTCTSCPRHT